jgi:hypothetical protein
LGNHRDAWTFGALDPSSGTASMIEVVRALGEIKKNKGTYYTCYKNVDFFKFNFLLVCVEWRPRRTMVFCSWGAEEYGLIGSYEWTQQFAKVLSQRAVAYLNVDVAVGGKEEKANKKISPDKNTTDINFQFPGNQTFRGSAYPMLKQLLIDSSKLVPNPNPAEVADGRETVFQTWVKYQPDANNPGNPS